MQRPFIPVNCNPNASSDQRNPRQKKTPVNGKAHRFVGSVAVHHKVLMIVHGRHASSGRLKIRMNTKLLIKRMTSAQSRAAITIKRIFRSVLEAFILCLFSMRVEEKLSDMTSESSVSVDVNYHVNDLMQKLLNNRIRQLASR